MLKEMLLVFKKTTSSLKITGSNASFNFIKILIIIASIINWTTIINVRFKTK